MRFLYLFNTYKMIFTVIVLALNVINVLSEYETIEENENITISTLSCMESKFQSKYNSPLINYYGTLSLQHKY